MEEEEPNLKEDHWQWKAGHELVHIINDSFLGIFLAHTRCALVALALCATLTFGWLPAACSS